jgi:hypothetical protein
MPNKLQLTSIAISRGQKILYSYELLNNFIVFLLIVSVQTKKEFTFDEEEFTFEN